MRGNHDREAVNNRAGKAARTEAGRFGIAPAMLVLLKKIVERFTMGFGELEYQPNVFRLRFEIRELGQ